MPECALGSDLRRIIGSDAVLTDKAARVWAGTDFITQRGVPAAVARPTSSDQVVALLRYAVEHSVPIVPRGGATNLSGAIAPGDESLVLDLTSMNRIVEIDAQARRAVVEPGVINADLKAAAAAAGLVYAPDPASTPISTIAIIALMRCRTAVAFPVFSPADVLHIRAHVAGFRRREPAVSDHQL